jgi:hypothetical protein
MEHGFVVGVSNLFFQTILLAFAYVFVKLHVPVPNVASMMERLLME